MRRFLVLCCFSVAVFSPPAVSSRRDADLLLRVRTRRLVDDNGVLGDWSGPGGPCNWTGVACDGRSGDVVSIDLGGLGVSGGFPADFCRILSLRRLNLSDNYFGGEISAGSFSLCFRLEILDLSSNLLVGELPELRRDFENLTELYLHSNNFTGEIPASFSRMRKLEKLNLVNNLLNGTIPEWLWNLTELTHLEIALNPFAASRLAPSIGNLGKLELLFARQANIIGPIPHSIGSLSRLRSIDLSSNKLSGEIPETIGGLRSAEQILLYDNRISGELPDTFSNLTSLAFFDASQNRLTGKIPESLAGLHLVLLHLNDNNLEGEIPDVLSLNPNLSELKLFNNRITGVLPENLGTNSELTDFDVSGNKLEGPLPPNLCSKKALQTLIIFKNRFSGSIPETYGDCSSLTYVRFQNNELAGEVPSGFWGLPGYKLFELQNNNLAGRIPPSISNDQELTEILISGNNFSGEIPPELCKLQKVAIMDLSRNRFSGALPSCLTSLKNLQKLHLQENLIQGEIPKSIESWSELTDLNLSFNKLSGEIPSSIGSLPVLNYLDLSSNNISGEIPSSLTRLKLNGFNLSNNNLKGKVPSEFDNSIYQSSLTGNPGLCSSTHLTNLPSCTNHKLARSYLVGILILSAFSLVGLLAWILTKMTSSWRKRGNNKRPSLMRIAFQRIVFEETELLESLTSDNLIARGGSCQVFRVQLRNGQMVAVKKLMGEASRETGEKESEELFKSEVETLGNVRHKNIVKLLYGCSGKDFKILVYEYMENGSLGDVLHRQQIGEEEGGGGEVVLDWPKRFNIAVGAAQGLAYLHHDCVPPILHRDIKSNNILLDKDFRPKVADFGLAKMLYEGGAKVQEQHDHDMSCVAGSYGYIAPEYAYTLRISESSDVYSFGVVLLELISGKWPNDASFGESNGGIVQWVLNTIISSSSSSSEQSQENNNGHRCNDFAKLSQIVDPRMCPSTHDYGEIRRLLNVALLCTSALPIDRPSMRKVVELLRDISLSPSKSRR
ncbi:unnamed protein product [Cuscuta campestris]|uniref:non-specific serine/threonine protein kinase n=1 Tax=Cuscuta campestris TaxID=132261 RepID=A0A484L0C9_9ASTE|nr:unnamed protein product [Cuscuta campestris]